MRKKIDKTYRFAGLSLFENSNKPPGVSLLEVFVLNEQKKPFSSIPIEYEFRIFARGFRTSGDNFCQREQLSLNEIPFSFILDAKLFWLCWTRLFRKINFFNKSFEARWEFKILDERKLWSSESSFLISIVCVLKPFSFRTKIDWVSTKILFCPIFIENLP